MKNLKIPNYIQSILALLMFISNLSAISLCFIVIRPSTSIAQDFFEERYRGWLWFEDHEKIKEQQRRQEQAEIKQKQKAEFARAKREVEQFAKELEDLRYMMIRYPDNIEHYKAYKAKEAIMLDNALKLDQTHRLSMLLNPDSVDRLKEPVNLYGRRIKEKLDAEENARLLKELASEVELFLFFSSSCPYCQQIEPVLYEFATRYGFKVEAVSVDGSTSKHFKTYQDADLATKLELKFTPTVILVTNDSKIRLELARGATAQSELEEQGVLAFKYIKSLESNNNEFTSTREKTKVNINTRTNTHIKTKEVTKVGAGL